MEDGLQTCRVLVHIGADLVQVGAESKRNEGWMNGWYQLVYSLVLNLNFCGVKNCPIKKHGRRRRVSERVSYRNKKSEIVASLGDGVDVG